MKAGTQFNKCSGLFDIRCSDFIVPSGKTPNALPHSNKLEIIYIYIYVYMYMYICRVSQEEWTKLRERVPYVELYPYNPKHLYPKLNGYGDNGQRKVWASGMSAYCTPSVTPHSSTSHVRQRDTAS